MRATNVKLMVMKQKLLEVEGLKVPDDEQLEIDLQVIVQSVKIVGMFMKEVREVVLEWEGSQLKERARKKQSKTN